MTDASFKPAGAAFAALVAGLAPAAEAIEVQSTQHEAAREAAEAQAKAEFAAKFASSPAMEPFSTPEEAPRHDADVPLSGLGD